MKRIHHWAPICALILIGCGSKEDELAAYRDLINNQEETSTEIALDNKRAKPPEEWVEKPPISQFRHAVFELKRAPDDKNNATLIIFKGIGGDAEANIKRWKGQFEPPDGKKIEDVAKVNDKETVAGFPASRLDVRGTFLDKPFPMAPKAIKRPGYRMIAYHVEGPRNIFHIKFYGPEKTVDLHEKELNEWLKSFK